MITLKTLNDTTLQQVFDQVANHLMDQGEICADGEGSCRYRYNGLKCAAGCLIADDEYDSKCESLYANKAFEEMVNTEFNQTIMGLVISLQEVHDKCEVAYWPKELVVVAEDHDLSISPELQAKFDSFVPKGVI